MPKFIAPLTDELACLNKDEQWYHIPVELPPELASMRTGDTNAYISVSPEKGNETVISEELAGRYGATKQLQQVTVVIRQEQKGKLHRFELPVTVRFASPALGKEYLQIGTDDLDAHFEIAVLESDEDPKKPDYLFLRLDPTKTQLKCVESNLPWRVNSENTEA